MTIDCKTLQNRGGWWEDLLTNRCSFPIAPVNTYSNLAYVLAGLLVYSVHPNLAALVQALAFIFLGIGSALYHGTKRGWASKLDNAGMYTAFISLTTYSLAPTNPFIGPTMALVALAVAWRLTYHSSWTLLYPMMGVCVAITTLSVALNGSWLMALIGLGTFGAAYTVWWADKDRKFFLPKFGHGIWHLLTAMAMAELFLGRIG